MKINDSDVLKPTSKGKSQLAHEPNQIGCRILQSILEGHKTLSALTAYWKGKDLAPRSKVYRENPYKYIRDYLLWMIKNEWLESTQSLPSKEIEVKKKHQSSIMTTMIKRLK